MRWTLQRSLAAREEDGDVEEWGAWPVLPHHMRQWSSPSLTLSPNLCTDPRDHHDRRQTNGAHLQRACSGVMTTPPTPKPS
eukprot:2434287-Rhodomonas_salina.1